MRRIAFRKRAEEDSGLRFSTTLGKKKCLGISQRVSTQRAWHCNSEGREPDQYGCCTPDESVIGSAGDFVPHGTFLLFSSYSLMQAEQ